MLVASSAEAMSAAAAQSLSPGDSYLEIEPDGALNALVVRHVAGDEPAAPRPIDWNRLFAEARLDPARVPVIAIGR